MGLVWVGRMDVLLGTVMGVEWARWLERRKDGGLGDM